MFVEIAFCSWASWIRSLTSLRDLQKKRTDMYDMYLKKHIFQILGIFWYLVIHVKQLLQPSKPDRTKLQWRVNDWAWSANSAWSFWDISAVIWFGLVAAEEANFFSPQSRRKWPEVEVEDRRRWFGAGDLCCEWLNCFRCCALKNCSCVVLKDSGTRWWLVKKNSSRTSKLKKTGTKGIPQPPASGGRSGEVA